MSDLGPAFIAVVAAIGYGTRRRCTLWRLQLEARSWERGLFESSITGFGLFIVARLIVTVVRPWSAGFPGFEVFREALPFPFAGTFALSLVLGAALAWGMNRRYGNEKALRSVMEETADELRAILGEAALSGWPVMLTLTDGKVYVGFVLSAPRLGDNGSHIRVLPTISGHRTPTRTVEFTTKYEPVYAEILGAGASGTPLTLEDFGVVVPLGEILSARRFESDVFEKHFALHPPAPAV